MNTHVPLRSILLATNLTDIEWLFPFTCSLAEESGARITVLHVITALNGFSIDLAGIPYYHPGEAIDAAKAQLQAACCRPCAASVHSEVVAIDGTPSSAILTTAEEVQADLLVMGTRCHRGFDKWLHGSVAEEVLRSSPVPVVTVGPHARKAAASGRPIKSILFATSLQAQQTDRVSLNLIYRWIERLHGHLTLLHVASGRNLGLEQERNCAAREEEFHKLLPEDAFRTNLAEAHVRTGRASREILAAAAGADLITLGAARQPVLGRLAREGTLYQVLAEARCPVATLHSEPGRTTHTWRDPRNRSAAPTRRLSTPAGPATP